MKKPVSLILAIVLAFGLVPSHALANEAAPLSSADDSVSAIRSDATLLDAGYPEDAEYVDPSEYALNGEDEALAGDSAADAVEASGSEASGDEDQATAIEDDAVQGPANSWRFQNGEPIGSDDGIALASVDAQEVPNAWQKTPNGYINSRGEVIKGALCKGIDVSQWNGKIDWAKVKNDGIDFAIIRCGWGSEFTTSKALVTKPGLPDSQISKKQDDTYWAYNVSECERLGIPYGVYIYSYAKDVKDAQSEAVHALRLLKGHNPVYPVYYDMEDSSTFVKGESLSERRSRFSAMAKVFCDTIAAAGYTPGVYANTNWWTNYLTHSSFNNYERWVAQYWYKCSYTGSYRIWQCTSEGAVDGISGNVDINFDFVGYDDVESAKVTRLSGASSPDTAAAIAKTAFSKSNCVVLARRDNPFDALGASGLAGTLNAPILLTSSSGLSAATSKAITSLGATKVYIVGGTVAISPEVEAALAKQGVSSTRIAGANASETSVMCAKEIVERGGSTSEVIVARSDSFQDALSMSSYAYANEVPVILVQKGTLENRTLTPSAKALLGKGGALQGASIIVPGGTAAISDEAIKVVRSSYTRIAGKDAYATSNQVAHWCLRKGMSASTVVIACGEKANNGVDALAGAALAGKNKSVILLVPKSVAQVALNTTIMGTDSQGSEAFLAAHASSIQRAYVLGGKAAVPSPTFNRVVTTIEG